MIDTVREWLPATAEPSNADDDTSVPTNLYKCATCDVTFVSKSMDTCPDCSDSVESVPTERDLGLI